MPPDRSSRHFFNPLAGDRCMLHDPRDIRALAHPARMAIIDALASGDELTATECAELTGLSPSATAYHLKLLERYDFAERAPARNDGRERPWRATDRGRRRPRHLHSGRCRRDGRRGLAYFERSRTVAEEFAAPSTRSPRSGRTSPP